MKYEYIIENTPCHTVTSYIIHDILLIIHDEL